MPHRDQEIAMLRRQLEMLMGERQCLLRVVGASAVLVADCDKESASAARDTLSWRATAAKTAI